MRGRREDGEFKTRRLGKAMQRVLWNRSRLHNPGEGKECASSSSGTVGSAASGLIAVPPGACMRRRGRRGSECGTAGGQLSLAARGGNA